MRRCSMPSVKFLSNSQQLSTVHRKRHCLTEGTHEAGDHVLRGHHVVCKHGQQMIRDHSFTLPSGVTSCCTRQLEGATAAARTVCRVLQEVVDHLQQRGARVSRSWYSNAAGRHTTMPAACCPTQLTTPCCFHHLPPLGRARVRPPHLQRQPGIDLVVDCRVHHQQDVAGHHQPGGVWKLPDGDDFWDPRAKSPAAAYSQVPIPAPLHCMADGKNTCCSTITDKQQPHAGNMSHQRTQRGSSAKTTVPESADGNERVQEEGAAEGRGNALFAVLHRWRLRDRLDLQASSTAGMSNQQVNGQQQGNSHAWRQSAPPVVYIRPAAHLWQQGVREAECQDAKGLEHLCMTCAHALLSPTSVGTPQCRSTGRHHTWCPAVGRAACQLQVECQVAHLEHSPAGRLALRYAMVNGRPVQLLACTKSTG